MTLYIRTAAASLTASALGVLEKVQLHIVPAVFKLLSRTARLQETEREA